MPIPDITALLQELADGRTDVVVDLLSAGIPAHSADAYGTRLIQHCAYFGDVTALRLLLDRGETLVALGDDLGLTAAVFHGHWRLTRFLLLSGADPNHTSPDTGETPLHNALCTTDRLVYDRVLRVLLNAGANPNVVTRAGIQTGSFMRDARTRGETPLHRAAAFGDEGTIQLLLDAGAQVNARDANGDSPLSWASWSLRPSTILRQLCFDGFQINAANRPMRASLLGDP